MRPIALLTTMLAIIAAPLGAQQTRMAPEGHVPPPARIAEAEWLVGSWIGEGIEGGEAHESWLPPSGGTMVGVFVQEKPDGTILFTEHMYLAEENGSLVVKLKHFNPDLTGWEEKDLMVRFPLVAIEPCAAYFRSLTYRCEDPSKGPASGMVVAVRMKGDTPEVKELVFRFRRAD